MGQRSVRVNELIKREISHLLHTAYQSESVYITITEVDVAPDLRQASVYYSVIGSTHDQHEAKRFLDSKNKEIRRHLSKTIVLKYLPHLRFVYDPSVERGTEILKMLDELDEETES